MNNTPQQSDYDDVEGYISTAEELASYLNENRGVAAALVQEMADEAVSDGTNPVRDILDNGYEASFDIDDLFNLNEELEAIVMTPMIETTTDWAQPFEDHDFGIGIQTSLGDIGVAEELASDFYHCLLQVCLDLVEDRGKSKPNSGFVDIFGEKVYEVFRKKLDEKQAQEQQLKQAQAQGFERKRERLQLLDQLLRERIEFEDQFERQWWPELQRQLASDLRDPWDYLHHWLIERRLELDRLLELQQNRYQDLDAEQDDMEEENETQVMLRDTLTEAIEVAVPMIAVWIKETIEAEGESLVFNALKRMPS